MKRQSQNIFKKQRDIMAVPSDLLKSININ